MPKKSKAAMHLFALAATVLWALGYVMTRIAIRHFTPEAMAFLRYFIAAVSLLIYACIKKMRLPQLKDIPWFIFGGAIGFAVYVYAINTGSKTLTASVVSFIISASPIITALLARVFLDERIGVAGWVSVICSFLGVGVITFYNGGFSFGSGVMWICLALILISVYNIFQRKIFAKYDPLETTTYCIISGAVLLSVFAPGSFTQIMTATYTQLLALLVLGIFSAGIAYVCWAYALSLAEKTSEVTNYMFMTPIITTFLGFILINEAPHISAYIGGALVLLGVFLVNRRKTLLTRKFS